MNPTLNNIFWLEARAREMNLKPMLTKEERQHKANIVAFFKKVMR